jgi:hypothetical protein
MAAPTKSQSQSASAPVVLAGMPKPKADIDHAGILQTLMGITINPRPTKEERN